MTSHSKIIDYIKNITAISEDESLQFGASFKEVKIKRQQFIIQPGFVAKSRYFVVKGAMRAYVIDNDGQPNYNPFLKEMGYICFNCG
ncbi:MAG: hypothetical protein QM764_13130 [Chitinophagaceae bacterium]